MTSDRNIAVGVHKKKTTTQKRDEKFRLAFCKMAIAVVIWYLDSAADFKMLSAVELVYNVHVLLELF